MIKPKCEGCEAAELILALVRSHKMLRGDCDDWRQVAADILDERDAALKEIAELKTKIRSLAQRNGKGKKGAKRKAKK